MILLLTQTIVILKLFSSHGCAWSTLLILQARNILLRAKNVFKDLAEENPNKANMADYIEAVLEAR